MGASEDSLSRRVDRLAYAAAAPDTALLLGALKELALALEAIEEKVDRLAAATASGMALRTEMAPPGPHPADASR
jgi:predicted transcriptional regulator